MRTYQKTALLFLASPFYFIPQSFAAFHCDETLSLALEAAKVATQNDIRDDLELAKDDELNVELIREPETLCLAKKYPSGPRYIIEYRIAASAKRKSDNGLFADTRAKKIDGALMIAYEKNPKSAYSCELEIDWIDTPTMMNVITGKQETEDHETFPATQFWQTPKSAATDALPDSEDGIPDCTVSDL
jgi:hypothetical protein